jgi:hypothetical protein
VARVPGNPIGWLLCLLGLALAASLFVEQYGLRGLATAPGSLPAVRQVAALGASTTLLTVAPLIILVLLFPDGHLPSRRWRPVLWAAIAAAIVAGFGQLLQRGLVISGSLTNALLAAGVAFPNPFGVFPRHGWYSDVIGAMAAVAGITAVLALVSVFVRRRGASAELRQQLAWLAYVGALTAAFAVVMAGYSLVTGGDTWVGSVLFILTFGTPIFGIPLACAVAVLRYRLYDLDIVVKRTVVAAVVAAVFTAVYVLVVVVVGAATGQSGGNPLTFVAAVLAAVLLQPVRTRTGWSTAGVPHPTRCCRNSPNTWPVRTRPKTSCRGWPGCWRRPPARNGRRCGCGRPAASIWGRRGRPRTGRRPQSPG